MKNHVYIIQTQTLSMLRCKLGIRKARISPFAESQICSNITNQTNDVQTIRKSDNKTSAESYKHMRSRKDSMQ